MAKEQGTNKLLANCPSCILSLEQRLELMPESGEPMEFGIFDFYKVLSRAFGEEEEDGAAGNWNGSLPCHPKMNSGASLLFHFFILFCYLKKHIVL